MAQMCKMVMSAGVFFNLKIFIIWFLKGLKGQKVTQNDMSVTRLIFQNHISYDFHLWYTYMYKKIISPGIFFIFYFFKILIFGGFRVGWGVKKQPKITYFSMVCFMSQEL